MSMSSTSAPSAFARGERVEGEAGGVGALLARDHRAPARSPQILQLLDGGGAEGVAGGEHHLLAFGAKLAASLPMVVVLPEPLTPTTRMTKGFAPSTSSGLRHRRQHLFDLGGKHRLHLVRRDLLVVSALRRSLRDARGDIDAEIGADQRFLEFIEHRRIELALGHEVGNGAAERR